MTSYWQNPQLLALLGLGTDGGQPLADGSILDQGVHLRWQFLTKLGFPPGGFDVFRREHEAGYQFCADFRVDAPIVLWDEAELDADVSFTGEVEKTRACWIDGQYKNGFRLPGHQVLEFALHTTARTATVTFGRATGSVPKGIAYWSSPEGEVEVGRATAVEDPVTGHYTLTFYADAIDRVEIVGLDMRVCELCVVQAQSNLDVGWGPPLNPERIHLPVTHPDWPGVHANQPDDTAEAADRLPTGLDPALIDEYLDGFAADVQGMLYDMVSKDVHTRYRVEDPGVSDDSLPAPTGFSWPGIQLLHLMALDPNFARILGMYWHDEPPDADTYYDYRVTGYWEGSLHPPTDYNLGDLLEGTQSTTFVTTAGLRVTSPEPLEVITGTWDGVERQALRFEALIPQTSVVLTLPEPVPSVSLKIDCEGDVRVKGLLGVQRVEDLDFSAGIHRIRIDTEGHIGWLKLETDDPLTIIALSTRENAGVIDGVHYVTFHHRMEAPPDLLVPQIDEVVALPGSTSFSDDGERFSGKNAAGLRWQTHEAGGSFLKTDAPVLYHVERSEGGSGQQPSPSPTVTILNADNPTLLSQGGTVEARPAGWPEDPLHYIDRHLADGWYGYRVRGIDLFGRLGDWSKHEGLQLLDRFAPPPPVRVQASYLDPEDPQLPPADSGHAPGTKVTWEWSGARRLQAPGIETNGEFRIYHQPGELNQKKGWIVSVSDGAQYVLEADSAWAPLRDDPLGEMVRLDGTYFTIRAFSDSPTMHLSVDIPDGYEGPPRPGPYVITFSPDKEYWTDYRDPGQWRQRVHVEPAEATPIVRGVITGVAGTQSDGTVEVTTDQALDDNHDVFTPGVLICDGVVYQARTHDSSEVPLKITLRPQEIPTDPPADPPAVVQPAAGTSFAYYPGQEYTVYLPGVVLSPDAAQPTAVGHIAVSTSDNLPQGIDERFEQPVGGPPAGRPGNEGPASEAGKIIAAWRNRPDRPGNVPGAGPDPIFASPADFYGQARYTLVWEAVADAAEYAVHRCSGAALFSRDTAQRKKGAGPYAPDPFFDDPGFAAWLAEEFPAMDSNSLSNKAWRAWTARFYPSLSDPDVQALADLAGNEAAFSRVNADGITGLSYADVFDGRGSGFMVYKVRAIDAAGNPGVLSQAYPPVHIFDITPPAKPVVTAVLGDERSITIEWRANRETDLQEYRVWAAQEPEPLADVRRKAPDAVLAPTPDAVTERYTENELAGGEDRYFRLAAVDTSGNVSQATEILAGRAVDTIPPEPPIWVDARWIARGRRGIELTWQTLEPDLVCTVYRRPQGGGTWKAVSPPLEASTPPLDYAFIDGEVDPSEGYEYRIKAEDAAGNRAADYTVRTMWPFR